MENKDVRSVGYMMLELMEADTSLARPNSIQLQRPEHWKDGTGIKEFLAATHTMSREQLHKVGGLQMVFFSRLTLSSIHSFPKNLFEAA